MELTSLLTIKNFEWKTSEFAERSMNIMLSLIPGGEALGETVRDHFILSLASQGYALPAIQSEADRFDYCKSLYHCNQ